MARRLLALVWITAIWIAGTTGAAQAAQRITEYPIPTSMSYPVGIAAGPDQRVWLTELTGDNIGAIRPTTA